MKTCSACKLEKVSSEFTVDNRVRGGLSPACRGCKRSYEKTIYWKNLDRSRAAEKEKSRKHNLTPLRKFSTYKHSAKEKGKEFAITRDQFMALWQKPCYYCSATIKTIGIDRVNNEIGYTVENIVPCCALCNYAKRGLSKSEFVALCMGVVKTHEQREAGKAIMPPEKNPMTHGGNCGS